MDFWCYRFLTQLILNGISVGLDMDQGPSIRGALPLTNRKTRFFNCFQVRKIFLNETSVSPKLSMWSQVHKDSIFDVVESSFRGFAPFFCGDV